MTAQYREYMNRDLGLCGLCGNTGIIDTRGCVRSPAGVECGVLRWCICLNGRAWKRQQGQHPTETMARWMTALVGTT